MLSVIYAECRKQTPYAELSATMLNVIMLSVVHLLNVMAPK
jgi:hypothetical protein